MTVEGKLKDLSNSETRQPKFFVPVESYDFHIYYLNNSPASRNEAIALKNKIFEDFQAEVDADYMIVKALRNENIKGPHAISYFEVDIDDPITFVKFFSWAQVNHGTLSILVHPNTDNTYNDHTINASWIGDKLPLITDSLKGLGRNPTPWGYPQRELIKDGFYDKPELYTKRIVVRLLKAAPKDEFWNQELLDSYKELLK